MKRAGRYQRLLLQWRRHCFVTMVAVLAALVMQALAWTLLIYLFHIRHVWYTFFDASDVGYYREIAGQVAQGQHPYSSFPFEYPPLAAPLLTLPSRLSKLGSYELRFAGEMILLCAASAGFATAAASRLWQGLRRPLATGLAFAGAVMLTGAITANRFDAAVALDIAVFAYCLTRRWWWPAAAVLGLGFALKLTPAMFLPLVLLLAVSTRAAVSPVLGPPL